MCDLKQLQWKFNFLLILVAPVEKKKSGMNATRSGANVHLFFLVGCGFSSADTDYEKLGRLKDDIWDWYSFTVKRF